MDNDLDSFASGTNSADADPFFGQGKSRPLSSPLFHSLAFVLGFSAVFTAQGALLGLIGFGNWRDWIEIIAGIILIIIGLNVGGLLNIGWLRYIVYRERRLDIRFGNRPHYLKSCIVGSVFAIGWTPCVGLILAGILSMTLSGSTTEGSILMLAYSLGLGFPFILVGAFFGVARKWLKGIAPYMEFIEIINGLLLILIGSLILTDSLQQLNSYFAFIPTATGSSQITSMGIGSMIIAFIGGMLSFLSPCVLPLVPFWMSYMVGSWTSNYLSSSKGYTGTSVDSTH